MTLRTFAVLASTVLVMQGIAARADESAFPPEVERLIVAQNLIAGAYRWDFEYQILRLPPEHQGITADDLTQRSRDEIASHFVANETMSSVSGTMTYDTVADRFYLTAKEHVKGVETEQNRTVNWAFDGKIYSHHYLVADDLEKVSDSRVLRKIGRIETENSEVDNLVAAIGRSGVQFFPQFSPALLGTSESTPLLRRREYLHALAKSNRIVLCGDSPPCIGVSYELVSAAETVGNSFSTIATVLFDQSKAGALVWLSSQASLDPNTSGFWTKVELKEVMPSVWLPELIVTIHASGGFGSQIVVSNIEVDPELRAVDFSVKMPPGTQVDDHVADMRYIVSESPVEEVKAIDDYLKAHKVLYPVEILKSDKNQRGRTYLIVGNILAVVVVLLFYFRSRKSTILSTVFCVFLIPIGATATELNEVGEMHWNHGWWYSRPHSPPVQITQCGFNVGVTALRLLGLPFDPNSLAESMPPTLSGIRASDIATSLTSHGVAVDARGHVSLRTLVKDLQPGEIVIVPVKPRSASTLHYVVLLCGPDKQTLLLDPPHRLIPTEEISEATYDENRDLTVLYLSQRSLIRGFQTQAEGLRLFPPAVDISSDGPDEYTGVVEISNRSTDAIPITRIVSGCSCVRLLDGTPGTVLPSSSKSIRFAVNRSGIGSSRIEVQLHLADGSKKSLTIRGPQPLASNDNSVFSTFRHCRVSNREMKRREVLTLIQIPQQWSSTIFEDDDVDCSSDWCSVTLQRMEYSEGLFLVCRVPLNDAIMGRISSGISESMKILVKSADGVPKVVVHLGLRREQIARIVPCMIPAGVNSAKTLIKTSGESPDAWQLYSISPKEAQSVAIEYKALSTGVWEVHVLREHDSKPSTFVADCSFRHRDPSIAPF